MAGLIIEVSEPAQHGTRLFRFETFPVRVGRGYHNDLVVQDPFVSPEHLVLTEDGNGYLVQDLESTNGTSVAGRRMTGRLCPAASGDLVVLGGTSLRILSPAHPVPPAQKQGFWATVEKKGSFYLLAWLSLLPVFGVVVLFEYLSTYEKVRWLNLAKEGLSNILLLLAWTAFWAAIGYSVSRRTRFHAQLILGSLFFAAMSFFDVLPGYLAYAVNVPGLEIGGSFFIGGVLATFLLFHALGLATTMKPKRRAIVALLITMLVLLMGLLMHFAEIPEFSKTPRFSGTLKPPFSKWAGSRSVDRFLVDSEEVFEINAQPADP